MHKNRSLAKVSKQATLVQEKASVTFSKAKKKAEGLYAHSFQ